jgi:hypothetical protein
MTSQAMTFTIVELEINSDKQQVQQKRIFSLVDMIMGNAY